MKSKKMEKSSTALMNYLNHSKIKHSLNHFALKAKILIKANMAAMG